MNAGCEYWVINQLTMRLLSSSLSDQPSARKSQSPPHRPRQRAVSAAGSNAAAHFHAYAWRRRRCEGDWSRWRDDAEGRADVPSTSQPYLQHQYITEIPLYHLDARSMKKLLDYSSKLFTSPPCTLILFLLMILNCDCISHCSSHTKTSSNYDTATKNPGSERTKFPHRWRK